MRRANKRSNPIRLSLWGQIHAAGPEGSRRQRQVNTYNQAAHGLENTCAGAQPMPQSSETPRSGMWKNVGHTPTRLAFGMTISLLAGAPAAAECTAPSFLVPAPDFSLTAPDPPPVHLNPGVPDCLIGYQSTGQHSCDDVVFQGYLDDLSAYVDAVNAYISAAATFANDSARFTNDAIAMAEGAREFATEAQSFGQCVTEDIQDRRR